MSLDAMRSTLLGSAAAFRVVDIEARARAATQARTNLKTHAPRGVSIDVLLGKGKDFGGPCPGASAIIASVPVMRKPHIASSHRTRRYSRNLHGA
jgi:hypothetical protein